MKIIFLSDRQYRDINPIGLGYEECKSGKSCSNYPRTSTTLHYVYSGCGTLKKGRKTYSVKAGEAFIIHSGEVASYVADGNDPWVYSWVVFNGEKSTDFRKLPAVFPHSPELFRDMLTVENSELNKESYIAGLLFRLHSEIKPEERMTAEYVKKIMNIINQNYIYDIRVEKIAEELNLNRHYISTLFKKETGKSILEYLVYVRLSEAQRYLSEGRGVTETAGLVGYTDSSTFSKMFKKYVGLSPIKYRKTKKHYEKLQAERGSIVLE